MTITTFFVSFLFRFFKQAGKYLNAYIADSGVKSIAMWRHTSATSRMSGQVCFVFDSSAISLFSITIFFHVVYFFIYFYPLFLLPAVKLKRKRYQCLTRSFQCFFSHKSFIFSEFWLSRLLRFSENNSNVTINWFNRGIRKIIAPETWFLCSFLRVLAFMQI